MTNDQWTGKMRTALLRQRLVHPAEFGSWSGALRYFGRHRRDRDTLAGIMETAATDGILEPLLVGVRLRDRHVFVYEGHHRAVVALELELPVIPFRWFWDPDLKVIQAEPFPYEQLHIREH